MNQEFIGGRELLLRVLLWVQSIMGQWNKGRSESMMKPALVLGSQPQSTEKLEAVMTAECKESVQPTNQTCSSIFGTDVNPPQPGNVVRDVVWEYVCFSRRKVCRKLDGQSIPNQTKSPYFTMENTKHLDPKSISEVSRPFKKRWEGETEKDSNCVQACHTRETSMGISNDAHVLSSPTTTCKSRNCPVNHTSSYFDVTVLEPSGVMGGFQSRMGIHRKESILFNPQGKILYPCAV